MKELAGLEHLQTLNVSFTKVSDEGLKELVKLRSLRTLNLRGTKVSDDGLKELAKLNHLQTLDIRRTKVTEEGVADLLQAVPNLTLIERREECFDMANDWGTEIRTSTVRQRGRDHGPPTLVRSAMDEAKPSVAVMDRSPP